MTRATHTTRNLPNGDEMNAYERNCRRLIRAYPPRYRKARGEELVGTLLELAEPGRNRPTLRDSLDVVRGGLVHRLRERPPAWRVLAYRLCHRRLPARYRDWARDDLLGRFHTEREFLLVLTLAAPLLLLDELTGFTEGFLGPRMYGGGNWLLSMGYAFLVGYLAALACRKRVRRRMLAKHGFRPDGSPLAPEALRP